MMYLMILREGKAGIFHENPSDFGVANDWIFILAVVLCLESVVLQNNGLLISSFQFNIEAIFPQMIGFRQPNSP